MEKQKKYCKEKKVPMFAPLTGSCFSCGKQVEDTDKEHLTGCPHCNRSWCD